MLVIFKSKAAGDLIMFEENARQILDLLGKDADQGIITAEQTAQAIVVLEKEIRQKKQEEAEEEKARRDAERRQEEEEYEADGEKREEDERKDAPPPGTNEVPVRFSARAYPFLQLLKFANKKRHDIVWGV
ncbi:MAG: DUF1840 domain-containing protein [Burkholderiaceae bacterium]|nr:DUF1840 domain-containing protein [Burkholderiaceae bacterium]